VSNNPEQQISQFLIRRYSGSGFERISDGVAIEEPLEIRITYSFKSTRRSEAAAVTMRTPGHDRELAAGFLLSEGVIARADDILNIRALGSGNSNEVLVELRDTVDVESWRLRRSTLLSSACGLCGKRTIESVRPSDRTVVQRACVTAEVVSRSPDLLRKHQHAFGASGGLHAAAFISIEGELKAIFEDIGRHNALDKLIGKRILQNQVPMDHGLLFMSSRGSFELVQKAAAAGCGILATIGAPSSLAIEYARDRGITLIGFVRSDHFNVYSGEWRIVST
jgi:FdhD protein